MSFFLSLYISINTLLLCPLSISMLSPVLTLSPHVRLHVYLYLCRLYCYSFSFSLRIIHSSPLSDSYSSSFLYPHIARLAIISIFLCPPYFPPFLSFLSFYLSYFFLNTILRSCLPIILFSPVSLLFPLMFSYSTQTVVGELTEVGQRLVVATGGLGGKGNAALRTKGTYS